MDSGFKFVPAIIENIHITDILKSITDGFIAVDRNFVVQVWNETAAEILNVPATDIVGKNLLSTPTPLHGYPESVMEAFSTHLKKALDERVTINIQNYLAFKDKWFDVRLHPYHEGVLIYFKDVTFRKNQEMLLEKLLKQEITRHKMVARAVVDAQEKERAEIGKELHDNVNQILSTAKLFLEAAKNSPDDKIDLISRSAYNIHMAIDEIRNISRSLMPASISDLGLDASINDLVENIELTKALKIGFRTFGEVESRLTDNQKLMLFRITQEQVNNVLKHAHATEITILLSERENYIDLVVQDNGRGFDLEAIRQHKGVGISNIISRAEMFNGKVDIQTSPGNGCKLKVTIPV